MENTQFRENHDGNSSSRGSGYDQRDGRHAGGGGRGQDRGGVRQHSKDGGGRGYDRDRGGRSYRGGNRGGFGYPPNQNTSNRNQENEEKNDCSKRPRPHDKLSEDHMRDSSQDRNDRARHKDKQHENHARDQSPDRSSNEQYTQSQPQGAECGRNNNYMNWKQSNSQHYQGNSGNREQVYQQGYDIPYDGKRDYYSQGQGRHGTYGGQQYYNYSKQDEHNKYYYQQEPYGYYDDGRQKEFPKDRRPRYRVNVH